MRFNVNTTSPTTPIAEYIWLLPETDDANEAGGDDGLGGWHPLAVVTANGAGGPATLLWLHGNHLGTPVGASTTIDEAATIPRAGASRAACA